MKTKSKWAIFLLICSVMVIFTMGDAGAEDLDAVCENAGPRLDPVRDQG